MDYGRGWELGEGGGGFGGVGGFDFGVFFFNFGFGDEVFFYFGH